MDSVLRFVPSFNSFYWASTLSPTPTKPPFAGRFLCWDSALNYLDGTSPCSSDSLLFGVVTDLFTHLRKLWAFAPKNARYMEREKGCNQTGKERVLKNHRYLKRADSLIWLACLLQEGQWLEINLESQMPTCLWRALCLLQVRLDCTQMPRLHVLQPWIG